MGLWKFMAATSGYAKAHGGTPSKDENYMTEDRMRDLGIEGM